MNSSQIFTRVLAAGIVPIIRASDETKIIVVADALVKSGLGVLELSLSVPTGLKILESLANRFGDALLLGAGTVLDKSTASAAISAGARFIVSPSTDSSVIDTCKKHSVACVPGALTPTEIALAWKCGADAIKVFPAGTVGGPDYIRAIAAPRPDIVLFPCGGVNAQNASDYFDAGASALLVGSSLIDMMLPEKELPGYVLERASILMAIAATARSSRL